MMLVTKVNPHIINHFSTFFSLPMCQVLENNFFVKPVLNNLTTSGSSFFSPFVLEIRTIRRISKTKTEKRT